MLRKLIALTFFALVAHHTLLSQNTLSQIDSDRNFRRGQELMEKSNYGAARNAFEKYLAENEKGLKAIDAKYFVAYCAINLYHQDGEQLVTRFANDYSTHPKAALANYELGNFYYKDRNYKKAIAAFEKADLSQLNSEQRTEAYFKLGYAYFSSKQFQSALRNFNVVKRSTGAYGPAANYYAGYAEYQLEDYAQALTDLQRAEQDDAYKGVVPHMIANVYYKQQNYDGLIQYANRILNGNYRIRNESDLYLLLGDAYFYKEQYQQASSYFTQYLDKVNTQPRKEVQLHIGLSYFYTDSNKEAISSLKEVATDKGELGESASYYLGMLYLKERNLEFASTAFDRARHGSAEDIKEEAQFQFAKVNFELQHSGISIEALQKYIGEYPGGTHIEEANDLLSQAYLNSNDYDLAIQHIESVANRSNTMARAYQRATYLKAVSYFNNRSFPKAIQLFDKSIENPYDRELVVQAHFWKGEAFSIGRRFEQAINSYQQVLTADPVQPFTTNARYGMGYARYNLKEYDKALVHFRLFMRQTDKSGRNYHDAAMRLADCYYVEKSYQQALNQYQSTIKNGPDRAYGYLQSGIIQGVLNDVTSARVSFDQVIKRYPKSRYFDDALFERAQLDFEKGNYEQAAVAFTELLNKQPNSKFVPYGLQRRATAYYNLQQYDRTISDYQDFLKSHITHKEANNVLLGLQETLALQGRSSEFQAYLDNYKEANPDQEGLEEVEYEAAKNLYFNLEYEPAINRLTAFIDKYPDNINLLEAKYYLAEAYYRAEKDEEALAVYNELLEDRTFPLINRVIQRVGELEFASKRYENAIFFYQQLEEVATNKKQQYNAWSGMMESFYALSNYDSVDHFANLIITQGAVSLDASNKAQLFLGKSAYAKGDYATALDHFINTINTAKDIYGAEAQFLTAEIQNLQEEYKQSNETLFELHKSFNNYEIWYDRSFLLIAENFVALDETFQAEQTLQSLIENSQLSFIVEQARARLKEIEEAEEEELQPQNPPDSTNNNNGGNN